MSHNRTSGESCISFIFCIFSSSWERRKKKKRIMILTTMLDLSLLHLKYSPFIKYHSTLLTSRDKKNSTLCKLLNFFLLNKINRFMKSFPFRNIFCVIKERKRKIWYLAGQNNSILCEKQRIGAKETSLIIV